MQDNTGIIRFQSIKTKNKEPRKVNIGLVTVMEDKTIYVKMMYELTKTAFLTCTMKTEFICQTSIVTTTTSQVL